MTTAEQRLHDLLVRVTPEPAEISVEAVAGRVRRRRIVMLGAAGMSVVVIGAAGAATYLATSSGGGRAAQTLTSVDTGTFQGKPVALVRSTMVIDPDPVKMYEETFAPPDALQLKYGPRLTAAQAWAKLADRRIGPHTAIPASTTAMLGSLTLAGHAANELAYGYRRPEGLCSGPSAENALPDPHPGECAHWTFLDANTGRLLDNVYGLAGFDGPVVIDSSINEVFTPSPAGSTALSAQAAWDAYNRRGDQPLPKGVTAQFGLLTQPTGPPGASHQYYVLKNRAVWAYRDVGGCQGGYGPSPLPTTAGGCISWTFLDPATGVELDATQQS